MWNIRAITSCCGQRRSRPAGKCRLAWLASRRNACRPSGRRCALDRCLEGEIHAEPGLYTAARIGHLGFSDITGTATTAPWDAPVTRLEVGGGYAIQRNLLAKLSYQHNRRDGGRLATSANLVATQLVYWF
jgi:hypothetical protein